ncbi:MAG: NEW3 domain-containing protein [Halobacteriota archaeon]
MEKIKAKAGKLVPILILFLFFLPLFSLYPLLVAAEGVEKRIEIRCDFPAQKIEAGDTAVFELTLINNDKTATYNLRYWAYREAKMWAIKFEDGDKEVYKVLLPEGSSKTVTLAVETPGDAKVGESPIHVDIGDGSITLYVKITETHKGEKGTLELTVVDKDGEKVKGATVSAYISGTPIDQMMTTAEGEVSIELPKGTYNVVIEKAGYKSEEEREVKIRIGRTTDLGIIPLEKELFFADVSVKSPSKTVMVGKNPVYEFEMKNVGKCDDTYRLIFQGLPDRWYARYKESATGTEEIAAIFIKSGDAKTLYLEFVPPYNVETGEYDFTSIVESSTRSYEQNLTLKMRGSHDMQVYSSRYRYELNKGDTVSFDVSVSNRGSGGSLTNISVGVSASEGWSADVTPKSVASLKPGDRRTFTIKVVPPADIVASDYKLSVKVKSEQVEKEDEFIIELKEQSNIAIYGVAILAAVIFGLWYMFRKYGRR